jgi:hypothetical protein
MVKMNAVLRAIPAGEHVVTEEGAGQQGELGLLHLALEGVQETLQQQGVHLVCGSG